MEILNKTTMTLHLEVEKSVKSMVISNLVKIRTDLANSLILCVEQVVCNAHWIDARNKQKMNIEWKQQWNTTMYALEINIQ